VANRAKSARESARKRPKMEKVLAHIRIDGWPRRDAQEEKTQVAKRSSCLLSCERGMMVLRAEMGRGGAGQSGVEPSEAEQNGAERGGAGRSGAEQGGAGRVVLQAKLQTEVQTGPSCRVDQTGSKAERDCCIIIVVQLGKVGPQQKG